MLSAFSRFVLSSINFCGALPSAQIRFGVKGFGPKVTFSKLISIGPVAPFKVFNTATIRSILFSCHGGISVTCKFSGGVQRTGTSPNRRDHSAIFSCNALEILIATKILFACMAEFYHLREPLKNRQ